MSHGTQHMASVGERETFPPLFGGKVWSLAGPEQHFPQAPWALNPVLTLTCGRHLGHHEQLHHTLLQKLLHRPKNCL